MAHSSLLTLAAIRPGAERQLMHHLLEPLRHAYWVSDVLRYNRIYYRPVRKLHKVFDEHNPSAR